MVITEKSVQRVENVETCKRCRKNEKKGENTSLQTKLFRMREGGTVFTVAAASNTLTKITNRQTILSA